MPAAKKRAAEATPDSADRESLRLLRLQVLLSARNQADGGDFVRRCRAAIAGTPEEFEAFLDSVDAGADGLQAPPSSPEPVIVVKNAKSVLARRTDFSNISHAYRELSQSYLASLDKEFYLPPPPIGDAVEELEPMQKTGYAVVSVARAPGSPIQPTYTLYMNNKFVELIPAELFNILRWFYRIPESDSRAVPFGVFSVPRRCRLPCRRTELVVEPKAAVVFRNVPVAPRQATNHKIRVEIPRIGMWQEVPSSCAVSWGRSHPIAAIFVDRQYEPEEAYIETEHHALALYPQHTIDGITVYTFHNFRGGCRLGQYKSFSPIIMGANTRLRLPDINRTYPPPWAAPLFIDQLLELSDGSLCMKLG